MDGKKELETLLVQLKELYSLSEKFTHDLSPLLKKIYADDTPDKSKQSLLADVHECCQRQQHSDGHVKNLQENLVGFAVNIDRMTKRLQCLQDDMEKGRKRISLAQLDGFAVNKSTPVQ